MDQLQQQMASAAGTSQTAHGPTDGGLDLGGPADLARLMAESNARPSLMYDDVQAPSQQGGTPVPPPAAGYADPAPPPQYQPQAPPQRQPYEDPNLLALRLQQVEAHNRHLQERAQIADFYDEALQANPELSNQFLAYYTGQSPTPPPAASTEQQAPQQQPQRPVRRRPSPYERQMLEEAAHARLLAESVDLQMRYPGVFNRQLVAQYGHHHGIRSMTEAFHRMMGEALATAWESGRQQQAPQGYAPQQVPQYAPPPPSGPPPAANVTVMRPGSRVGGVDPMDNVRPKNWNEVHTLMQHDLARDLGRIS